ncbi:MAG: SRPBCC family protein [Shimia sp.]
MHLSTRQEVAAPPARVFAAASDFAAFEARARARNAEVARVDDLPEPGIGATWDLAFAYRGKTRVARARVVEWRPGAGYRLVAETGGIEVGIDVSCEALGPGRTCLVVQAELAARTLSGRLLVQSLKLAKGNVDRRFAKAVRQFARGIDRPGRSGRRRAA